MYLPPDTNTLLSCFEHCMKTKDYINVLVTSKHVRPQWLTKKQAAKHCTQGLGIWDFTSNDQDSEPDVIMAWAGTLEALAAVDILHEHLSKLKIRFINIVDLFKLQSFKKYPHGLSDEESNALFTKKKPIIFNFHGYPTLIHELLYEKENHNIVVKGYLEEGSITTPFDMRVQNEIDRFHLVKEICNIDLILVVKVFI